MHPLTCWAWPTVAWWTIVRYAAYGPLPRPPVGREPVETRDDAVVVLAPRALRRERASDDEPRPTAQVIRLRRR